MAYKKKTWKEKLHDSKGFPKIIDYADNLPCGKALKKQGAEIGDKVVLAPPLDVNEIMAQVPEGKLLTLNDICHQLAEKYKVDYCCTLTTGIFVMTAANAAQETGEDVPYWRTIKNTGELNAKYPGGLEGHKKLLEKEGYRINQKGKRHFLDAFEQYVERFNQNGSDLSDS